MNIIQLLNRTIIENQQYENIENLLLQLVKQYPKSFASIVTRNKIIYDYVIKCTPKLVDSNTFKYTIGTRLYWIFNKLKDFPVCNFCHNKMEYKNVKLNTGYLQYCSTKCSSNDSTIKSKKEHTYKLRTGFNNPSQNPDIKQKKKETTFLHYGVENPNQSERIKQKKKETTFLHYGVEHPGQSKEVQEKIQKTSFEKYGGIGFGSKIVNQKIIKTINKKNNSNVINCSQLESIKQKKKETLLKHYGVENPNQSKEILEKTKKTCLEQYGVECVFQSDHYIKHKQYRLYYNNIGFHSRAEIDFYKLCESNLNKGEFEYQPKVDIQKFSYTYNGKTHFTIPDFRVKSSYIEIKGDQFILENGHWRDCYDKKDNGNKQQEARRQCMITNNVIIIKVSELKNFDFEKFLLERVK